MTRSVDADTRALDAATNEPLAHEIEGHVVGQRDGRHRRSRLLAIAQNLRLELGAVHAPWDSHCIGAHLFELLGTIVRNASALFKMERLDAHHLQAARHAQRHPLPFAPEAAE